MKIKSGNTGFSLIEVLVAILVFTISLFAIIPLLFTAVNVDSDTLMKVTAQRMMTETIDDLMAQTTLTDCTCTNGVPAGTCPAGTCTLTKNSFRTINGNQINNAWTISDDPNEICPRAAGLPPCLKLITVDVSYALGTETKNLRTEVRKGL